jgi:Fe2+ transport system protein FeoA
MTTEKISTPETIFRSEKVDSLSHFTRGQSGTIVEMVVEPELQGRLMGMGLFVGTRFHVIQNGSRNQQPMLIAIGETRIALGPSITSQILVEE